MGAIDEQSADLIQSDAFFSEISDAVASLVFPYFGFGGWIEHYTGYSPVWQLAHALPLWAKGIEKEVGWGVQALFKLPPYYEIPFFEPVEVKGAFKLVVQHTIEEQGWGPMLDAVREMPCDGDYEPWDTNVRKDFLRKWYHTRSKQVQTVSLEGLMEGEEDDRIFTLPDPVQNVEDYVAARDFVERFLATLPERDRQIVQYRQDGYSYAEIAEMLGYKNHSGVIKRMEAVRKKFDEYRRRE